MAKRKYKTKSSGGFSLFVYLIFVILLIGILGSIVLNLYEEYTAYAGMYVVYDSEEYTADESNSGITIEYGAAEFTIDSTDWGVYSVTDCVVKIVSNVSDSKVFEFYIGENSYRYTNGTIDLTAAASALPATTLTDSCYYSMYEGCTSLTTIPSLSHVTVFDADSCCYMFSACSNVCVSTDSSYGELLVTLGDYFYGGMFGNTGGDYTGGAVANTSYYTTNTMV